MNIARIMDQPEPLKAFMDEKRAIAKRAAELVQQQAWLDYLTKGGSVANA